MRATDSRGSDRPKASRGGERRAVCDADRLVIDDRPSDSRGSERPKASRGSANVRRASAAGDGDRIVFDDHRPIDSRGGEHPPPDRMTFDDQRPTDSRGGERPKASRGSDRLKSRGSDRGRQRSSEGDRPAERPGRYDVIEGEILLNQDKPLTLEDWFSNPGSPFFFPNFVLVCLKCRVCA